MENNFELEEMKQQWSTLQTTLNNQKEINIKLILKDAKKRISWNIGLLKTIFFITLFLTAPTFLFLVPLIGVPQSICTATALLLVAAAINALYMSFIVKTPNDGNIDILRYSKSLLKFKKHYFVSEGSTLLILIAIIIWAIISLGFDITNPMVIGSIVGGVIGAVIGVLLDIKMLDNIKELQNDIDLIEGLKE